MFQFRHLCLALVAALLAVPAAAQAATTTANVWVVPSGGSSSCVRQATPVSFDSAPSTAKCSSVQAAVNAMSGGDVALMKSGSYSGVSVSSVTRSPAVTVKVEFGGTATLGGGISFGSGANGVVLDGTQGANGKGFDTTGGASFGSNGGSLTQNVKLSGVNIHDGTGGQMIWMVGCSNVTVSHVEIAHISNADGIQMAKYTGQPECSNVTFDDIYMHDFNAICGVDHQDGIQIRAGSNITFTNSKIVDLKNCGSQGFFANQEGDLGGSNTTLSNTVISGINGNAINFSSKPPQRMINNTIDGGLNTCQPVTSTCTGVIMKNNILNSACAGQKILHDRVQNSSDWANNVSAYNCGYGAQGDTVVSNVTGMFVNPASPSYDFHLKSTAAAIGKATTAEFTATDMDGLARDSAPDAGADEYGNDLGTLPPATDTTAPDTTLSSAPSGSTETTSASVAFTGTDDTTAAGALAFECRLDGGAWIACTSPKAYSGLSVGSHTIAVRAKDAAGNVDASPATASWTITAPAPPADTTAPDTTITSAPSGSTEATSGSVAFTGTDDTTAAGSLTFECAIDGGSYAGCASPKAYSSLAVGTHTVSVRARDAAGNADASPATASWTVVAPAPAPSQDPAPAPSQDPAPAPSQDPAPAPAPATSGLVAAYSFNETSATTVSDASGNGLKGTITGATRTTAGKYGGALTFNGSGNMVTVPDNAKLDLTTGMTLEAWVRPSANSGWRSVLLKEQTNDLVYGLYSGTDTNNAGGWLFGGGAERNVRGGNPLTLNAWAHLATTFDGSVMRMYVNGNLVGAKSYSGTIATSSGALRIGGNKVWGEWFKGRIDEVRVYSRALSQSEVRTDMAKAI